MFFSQLRAFSIKNKKPFERSPLLSADPIRSLLQADDFISSMGAFLSAKGMSVQLYNQAALVVVLDYLLRGPYGDLSEKLIGLKKNHCSFNAKKTNMQPHYTSLLEKSEGLFYEEIKGMLLQQTTSSSLSYGT